MSRYYNPYLGMNAQDGLFFRDWQHAARLYVDDVYRLAPKPKWLYYAVFNFNQNAIANTAFQQQNRQEINFLVKKMDLPKYTLNIENLNQYNRKTTTYTRINYDPVNITFHDDNNGVSNAMWAMYYGYYFADRLNSQSPYSDVNPVAYQNHTYDSKSAWSYRYGLDTNASEPFFNSIQLMTLSKHKFTSYLLCHPRITSWQHDTMDQSEGNGVVENNMTVAYDAVIYTTGTVSYDNPSGFGTLHYDNQQSPLGPSNTAFLQGALNTIYSQDLMSINPFNTVDLGISVLSGARQNANLGNQASYGTFNRPNIGAILPAPLGPISTSGLQNYDFGSTLASTQNINQVLRAPIDESFDTGANAREEAITNQFVSSLTGAGALVNASTTDVFASNLPRTIESLSESKIFNSLNTTNPIPETSGAVNIDYFVEGDVVQNTSIISSELINNNPQNPDVPDNPFS